ncbi:MAG: hypothetical protein LBD44_06295 [Spirochaetaceae bacterium]|jgi:hypothetical protein|nr:hypothetical protein [Spirochaetaceae bacterium]
MTFEATSGNITGWVDKFALNFNLHGGLALNFGNGFRLDLDLMADLIHFEFGASVGFRYQQ